MLSSAPLRPSIPAVAQAARWWPQGSSGRPHRQLRAERGSARRRRRSKMTRKRSDGKVVSRFERCHCQRRTYTWSSLRPDQCLRLIWNAEEHVVAEFAFHSQTCFLLPTPSSGCAVFRFPGRWAPRARASHDGGSNSIPPEPVWPMTAPQLGTSGGSISPICVVVAGSSPCDMSTEVGGERAGTVLN